MDEDGAIPRWIKWLLTRRSQVLNKLAESFDTNNQQHSDACIVESIAAKSDSELSKNELCTKIMSHILNNELYLK